MYCTTNHAKISAVQERIYKLLAYQRLRTAKWYCGATWWAVRGQWPNPSLTVQPLQSFLLHRASPLRTPAHVDSPLMRTWYAGQRMVMVVSLKFTCIEWGDTADISGPHKTPQEHGQGPETCPLGGLQTYIWPSIRRNWESRNHLVPLSTSTRWKTV